VTKTPFQHIVKTLAHGDPPSFAPASGVGLPVAANDAAPLRVHLVDDDAGFDALEAEWDALLEQSQQQVYFLRFAWNRSWWRHHAPRGARPHILCCRDAQGRLVGLAPLYWRQHRMFGVAYLRELAFLGMGIELKTSEYMDSIARRGLERAVALAMADYLRGRDDWDRVWLHQVPADSSFLEHFGGTFGAHAETTQCDRAPYIDTSVSWEEYKQSLGRSMRRNVEYYARRLFKERACEFRRAATREEAGIALDALIRLHQVRWNSAGQPGSFSDPMLRTLLDDAVNADFDAGRVRLWTLTIDGKIEAALLGLLDNGVLHYFQKGFNPEFGKDGIGTALLGLCLRDSFDDPAIRAFDFMGGGAAYKDLWAREHRSTNTFVLDRFNLRSRLYMARAKLWEAGTIAFRKLAPDSLRAARRDYLISRMRRRSGRVLTHLLVPLGVYAVEALGVLGPLLNINLISL
jgi:CelD/BcsL family acetyltransferase involved in cellulose biosynthesis